MTFLGYEIDSIRIEVSLPLDRLTKCRELIHTCCQKPKLTLRQRQSILGTLNFACAVIMPGRAFLRRLIDLTMGISKPFHFIRITKEMREDVQLWGSFLTDFNGRSLFHPDVWCDSTSLNLYTDASGSLGYGAVYGSRWLYGAWSDEWKGCNITLLELYPIVLAVTTWGALLSNHCIHFHINNLALVSIINQQASRDKHIMHFVRRLVITC